MSIGRHVTQTLLTAGIAGFLAACTLGQGNSPPAGAERDGAATAATAPNTLAVGCLRQYVYAYAPESDKVVQSIGYGHDDFITSVVWDKFGNLFVGANGPNDSWVDEFAPGQGTQFRRISAGINDPAFLATDDEDNLYVGNLGPLGKWSGFVTIYRPGSTKPDVRISRDVGTLGGITTGKNYLWLTTSPFIGDSTLRNYQLNRDVLVWIVKGLNEPTALTIRGDDLYVEDYPHIIYQYNISGEPKLIRSMRSHSKLAGEITALDTDSRGNLLFTYSVEGHGAFFEAFSKSGDYLGNQPWRGYSLVANSVGGVYGADRKGELSYFKEDFKSSEDLLAEQWHVEPRDCAPLHLAVMR